MYISTSESYQLYSEVRLSTPGPHKSSNAIDLRPKELPIGENGAIVALEAFLQDGRPNLSRLGAISCHMRRKAVLVENFLLTRARWEGAVLGGPKRPLQWL